MLKRMFRPLAALMLGVAVLPLCVAGEQSPAGFEPLDAFVRCTDQADPRACRAELHERFAGPFARVVKGEQEMNSLHGAKALGDFQWAAKQGYVPAYEGVAMISGRSNHAEGLKWLRRAIEHGMAPSADYFTDHRAEGRTLVSKDDYFLYECIASHPAAIESTDFLRNLWDAKKGTLPEDMELLRRTEEALRARAADRRERFRMVCAADAPYFWGSTPAQMQMKQQTIRKRLKQTLDRIRQQLVRYPELRWLSSPEDLNLLPTFDHQTERSR